MPLRKWFTEHGHPSWYSWVVVIGGCLTSMVMSLVFAKIMTDNSIERSQRSMCAVVVVQDEVYRQTPPTLETGKQMAKAISDLRVAYGCP